MERVTIVECPYCGNDIGEVYQACCGEAGHGEEVTYWGEHKCQGRSDQRFNNALDHSKGVHKVGWSGAKGQSVLGGLLASHRTHDQGIERLRGIVRARIEEARKIKPKLV